jgi:hypothetical protein
MKCWNAIRRPYFWLSDSGVNSGIGFCWPCLVPFNSSVYWLHGDASFMPLSSNLCVLLSFFPTWAQWELYDMIGLVWVYLLIESCYWLATSFIRTCWHHRLQWCVGMISSAHREKVTRHQNREMMHHLDFWTSKLGQKLPDCEGTR